jgi:hypothetical protein
VVENLLSNAVKYSPGGGEVGLVVRRERETAVVSVSDHGIGIAAEDLGRLFRPVSRLLDRILPRLRAEEVAERLRAQAATRGVPLVLLASGEDVGPRASLFSECLSRPVERRILAAALERLGAPVH